jgi:iron complex outermembrane receptor protein
MKFANNSSAMAIALAIVGGATLWSQTASAADEAQVANAAAEFGEITVTARKREESLLKTPIAISALTSADLEKRGISSMNDVVNATPGINVSNVSSGRNDRSFQQISLRGMTPSTSSSTLTASFIDGVPVASATALNSVIDPARVEVLKGPQNAYFGRNAFAGAINIVTKRPGNDFGGSFTAMGGTRNNYEVSAAIEAPLVRDLLSFRLTGKAFSKDGSYKNRANPNQNLGDQQTRTGTLQLVFKPSSRLTATAMGLYSEDHDGPSAQGMISAYEVRANNGAANIPALSGSNAGTIIVPKMSNCNLLGYTAGVLSTEAKVSRPFMCGAAPALQSAFSPAQNTIEDPLLARILANGASRVGSPKNSTKGYGLRRQYYHFHLNVDYELGDTGVTLTSLTGYNNEYYSELADLDNYDSSLLRNPAATPANGLRAFWSFPFLIERRGKDFSQEVRATYDQGGAFKAMLGGSYLNTKSAGNILSVANEEVSGLPRAASSLSPPGEAKTFGVFGSVSYKLTDALTFNAEARFQRDKIYAFSGGRPLTISPAIAAQYSLPAGTYAPLTAFYNKSYDNFLPRVIVNYDVNPDMMIYATFSQAANVSLSSFNTAFLSGTAAEIATAEAIGLQVVTRPEKLNNYELGLKGKFLNGRVLISAAAYIADWNDQYNNRSNIFVDPQTRVSTIVSGVSNTGKTQLKGFELDINAEVMDGFVINAAGSINDSDIKSYADPAISKLTGIIGDGFKGHQLPLTSKYSANVGAQYTGKLAEDMTWFVRGDLSYKSRQFVDAGNLTWIKGRALVNARIGITRGDLSLEAFATNLFNNKRYISVAQSNVLDPTFSLTGSAFSYLTAALPELRTIGIKASYRF